MSPLKIALLLRCYSMTAPNAEIPERQAFAPAMFDALADFKRRGLIRPEATAENMRRCEGGGMWLTQKGVDLVEYIKSSADALLEEPSPMDTGLTAFPPPTRPAPPMPKIKPMRPSYEEMLRDEFARATMQHFTFHDGDDQDARRCYEIADAMLEARNANR